LISSRHQGSKSRHCSMLTAQQMGKFESQMQCSNRQCRPTCIGS
jgi:hypothetical protein